MPKGKTNNNEQIDYFSAENYNLLFWVLDPFIYIFYGNGYGDFFTIFR